jgi:hypothetical protein
MRTIADRQLSISTQLNCSQVAGFKMKTIGNHEFDVVLLRRSNHRYAVLRAGRHRLFAENMYSGRSGAHGVLAMKMVGKSDVDRINIGQHSSIVAVGVNVFQLILLP